MSDIAENHDPQPNHGSQPNHDAQPVIIVIKKIIKKNEHHGGAWKLAYADFVTAMMAFFLLMWLLSMLNKFQLMGISNYFSKPNKNTYIDNKKNDTKEKKIPAEQIKKYKLVLTDKRKAELDAQSFGTDKSGLHEKEKSDATKKSAGGQNDKAINDATKNASLKAQNDDIKALEALKNHLESSLESNDRLKQYRESLTFEVTKDGIKIKLGNLENQPMFSTGRTDFESHANDILEWLGAEVAQSNRYVSIIGHTDGNQYPNAVSPYTNWELSADRANATRRALIKYGADEHKFIRVQGAGDSILLDKQNPENAKNRRIEIILLSDRGRKKMLEND